MAASETTAFDIVSLGEPMVEFNQTGDDGGRLYLQGYGGDSSNFAIAAARQGARVAYVSAVGDVDGVVVVPSVQAQEVLKMAQEIDARELEQAKLIIAEKSLRKGLAKYGRI